jgi:hypothetical protein
VVDTRLISLEVSRRYCSGGSQRRRGMERRRKGRKQVQKGMSCM